MYMYLYFRLLPCCKLWPPPGLRKGESCSWVHPGLVRSTFPCSWVQEYGGEKIQMLLHIHDILPIPHHPNAASHPPTPRVGEGGEVGWGTWGWAGGVLEEYRVHMHTYTPVGTRITVGNKNGNSKMPYQIQAFSIILPVKLMNIRRAVD